MTYRIAPSMLSADFGRLKEEVQAIEAAGADLLHFDVMDNHYVPNLTVGPMVCKALRPHIRMPIDVHLIRSRGCKAGLVFNPATPLSWLDYTLDQLDIVLLMSVNPGFGGQSFIPGTLAKLRDARQRIDAEKARSGRDIWLEVDGGVKVDNIAEIAAAGADTFVAGSAVFGAPDPDGGYHGVLKRFREALA